MRVEYAKIGFFLVGFRGREGQKVMQKWRRRTVAVVRKLLTCAIGAIAVVFLVSVHTQVQLPSSEVTKLPTTVPLTLFTFMGCHFFFCFFFPIFFLGFDLLAGTSSLIVFFLI